MAVLRIQCRRPYHLLLLSILNIACKCFFAHPSVGDAIEQSLFSDDDWIYVHFGFCFVKDLYNFYWTKGPQTCWTAG